MGVAWTWPALNVGRGFAEAFEVTMSVGYGTDEPRTGPSQQGRQDASLALEWRLHDEDEDGQGAAWTIEPAINLPTGNRKAGVGGEELQLALPLRASNRIGRSRLIGQLGYFHALETGGGRRWVSPRFTSTGSLPIGCWDWKCCTTDRWTGPQAITCGRTRACAGKRRGDGGCPQRWGVAAPRMASRRKRLLG